MYDYFFLTHKRKPVNSKCFDLHIALNPSCKCMLNRKKIVSTDKYMVIETHTLEKIFVQQNKLLLGPANFGWVDQPIPH